MSIFEKDFKIGFWDIDSKNHITIRSLLKFMQETAGLHSEKAGYGLNNPDCSWVIINWKIKVFQKPSWNHTLTVRTWARTIEKFYSYRDYEILDEQKNIVAISTSKWIFINPHTHSISRITDTMVQDYGIIDKAVFPEPMDEKIKVPENLTFAYDYTIQRRDIDTNQHVNHLNYIDFALEAIPENIFEHLDISEIEVSYKKQILYPDKIHCFYSIVDGLPIITIKNETEDTIHSILKIS